jgi:uncharacterized protein with GYD domain
MKYLIKASYNSEGAKGLLKAGGTTRKQAVEKMMNDMGGKLESFYFAFGEQDVYAIGEIPDTATAVAISLSINASGLVTVSLTVLVDPEDVDKAKGISVNYRSPGN